MRFEAVNAIRVLGAVAGYAAFIAGAVEFLNPSQDLIPVLPEGEAALAVAGVGLLGPAVHYITGYRAANA